jgi:chaperonin GroEL
VAYLQAIKVLETLKPTDMDEAAGVRLVKEALQMPVRVLADNSGADGGWVVNTILEKNKPGFGFNAQTLEFGDMLSQGVIDPAKVAKHALMNAASVAGGILTTRVLITDIKEEKPAGHSHGGGMGDMM